MKHYISAGEELNKRLISRYPSIVPFNEDFSVGESHVEPFTDAFYEERSRAHGVTLQEYLAKWRPMIDLDAKIDGDDELELFFGEDPTCLANREFLVHYYGGIARKITLHLMDEHNAVELRAIVLSPQE